MKKIILAFGFLMSLQNLSATPSAPSGLTAVAGTTSTRLNWTNNATNAVKVIVERSTDNVNFVRIGGVASNRNTYIDFNLGIKTYYYRVAAIGSDGSQSAYAATANDSVLGPPIASWPFNLLFQSKYSLTGSADFSSSTVELSSALQTDTTSSNFSSGGLYGVNWDSSNGYIRLMNQGGCDGTYASCAGALAGPLYELNANWTPSWNNIISYFKLNGTIGTTLTNGASVSAAVGSNATATSDSLASTHLNYVNGKLNQAISFDGNNYFNLPCIDGNVFSASLWVKRADSNTGNAEPLICANDSDEWCFGFDSNDTLLMTDNDRIGVNSTARLTDTSAWHMVSFTLDGSGNLCFYIDGALDSCNGIYGYPFREGGDDYNLGYNDNDGTTFNGSMDEVSVWSDGTILSGSDIASLYSHGNSGQELDSYSSPSYSTLMGYWKMNGSLGALGSEASLPATVGGDGSISIHYNFPITYASGIADQSLNFDGNGDYLNAPYSASLKITSGLTVQAWVESYNPLSGGGTQWAVSMPYSDSATWSSPNTGYGIGLHYGIALCRINVGGVAYQVTSGYANGGKFNHLAMTYDGTTMNCYLNGALVGSVTASGSIQYSGSPKLTIGSRSADSPGEYFNGEVDEVAVWNTALSASSIAALNFHQGPLHSGIVTSRVMDGYNTSDSWSSLGWTSTLPFLKELPDGGSSETSANYSSQSSSLMNGLIALWHMDEASWTPYTLGQVRDSSGNPSPNDGYTGSYPSAAPQPTAGLFGNAGLFNYGEIYIGQLHGYDPTKFTISGWLTYQTYSSGNCFFSNASDGNNFFQGCINSSDHRFILEAASGGVSTTSFESNSTLPLNQWTHVVVTLDSVANKAKIFLNGRLDKTSTYASTPLPSNSFMLGGRPDNNLVGLMDEVAIWSRALGDGTNGTPNEVLELYRRGANRLKYQIRSCSNSDCSDDPTGANWKGPGNSAQTYFSELNNNQIQSDQGDLSSSDSVLTGLPNILFSNFTGLSISSNRYIQYRAILESDDPNYNLCSSSYYGSPCSPELKSVSIGPNHYNAATQAVVQNIAPVAYSTLASFTETLGTDGCSSGGGVKYIISPDGTHWYWYNAGAWTSSNASYSQASAGSALTPAAMASFATQVSAGELYLKAFLTSDGSHACELSNVSVTGHH